MHQGSNVARQTCSYKNIDVFEFVQFQAASGVLAAVGIAQRKPRSQIVYKQKRRRNRVLIFDWISLWTAQLTVYAKFGEDPDSSPEIFSDDI